MLIKTLFLRLFERDQSEIKEIVQEIVNIHNGAIFKNETVGLSFHIKTKAKFYVSHYSSEQEIFM